MTDFFSPEHSLRSAAIAVVAFYVGIGFVKGVAKQLLGMICLALAFLAGWAAFQYAPRLLQKSFGWNHPDIAIASSILAGAVVHIFSKRLLAGLVKPGQGVPGSPVARIQSAILSLIPAAFVLWVAGMGVRWTGVIASMRYIDEGMKKEEPSLASRSPIFARLQKVLTTDQVGSFFDATDPLHTTEASTLCGLLLVRRDDDAWSRLIKDPKAGPVLSHPALVRLVKDKDWLREANLANYVNLLTLPEIGQALKDSALTEKLRAINAEEAARRAIGLIPAQE